MTWSDNFSCAALMRGIELVLKRTQTNHTRMTRRKECTGKDNEIGLITTTRQLRNNMKTNTPYTHTLTLSLSLSLTPPRDHCYYQQPSQSSTLKLARDSKYVPPGLPPTHYKLEGILSDKADQLGPCDNGTIRQNRRKGTDPL